MTYRPPDISKFAATTCMSQLRKFWCWTRVSTKDWKYFSLSERVYAMSQLTIPNSCNKFLVRFRKKASSSQRRNLAKKGKKWPQIRVFWIFKKILWLVFPENEVYFWHVDNNWSFIQVDSIVLVVRSQVLCPKYSK